MVDLRIDRRRTEEIAHGCESLNYFLYKRLCIFKICVDFFLYTRLCIFEICTDDIFQGVYIHGCVSLKDIWTIFYNAWNMFSQFYEVNEESSISYSQGRQ